VAKGCGPLDNELFIIVGSGRHSFSCQESYQAFFSILVNFQAILMSWDVSESRKVAQKEFSRGKLDLGGIWIWH